MKVKTVRVCALKGCTHEFKLFRSTDKYCSPSCAYKDAKPLKQKPHAPIKPYSEKRKTESFLYTKKRKAFMELEENKYCFAAKLLFNEVHLCTEVHHKAGRKGKLLNYVPYWLAVCRKAHDWIHDNPTKSYELGLLIRPSTVTIK